MSSFLQAARHTDPANQLPHQDAAWQWAWEQLSKEQQEEFLEMFRADPPAKDQVANSWAGMAEAGRRHGARFPELVAAQWALESGYGKTMSGRNNPFGLKGAGTKKPTTEYVNGKPVQRIEEFRDFGSLDEAVSYLVSRWYQDYVTPKGKKYQGVNRAGDREAAARALVKEGYATDPAYAEKLIRLMNENAGPQRPVQQGPLKPPSGAERSEWVTAIKALNLSQPDENTCQAAAIGMAVGDRDVMNVRRKLLRQASATGGSAGSPKVMEAVIRSYGWPYRLEMDATLGQCYDWLKAGEFLITHGWFSASGHVLCLDGLRRNPNGSHDLNVKDSWGQFSENAWRYAGTARFFDGYYSDRCIYGACVAGTSVSDAERVYRAGKVDLAKGGMWVHRFLVS